MKYSIDKLENGLRVVHVPMRANPAVTAMVLFAVGSDYERKDQWGISHFLEHMLFKGTEKRPKGIDISRELDEMGASYNAFTSDEYTGYYVKAAKNHLDKIVDVLSDMVLNAEIREDDIVRERGVILEEINMQNDLPRSKANNLFMSQIFGDQPDGRETLGTKETISTFSREDLISFKKQYYTAENTLVVVAGGVSREKALSAIRPLLASTPRGKKSRKSKAKIYTPDSPVALEYKKIDQTHIVLGGRLCSRYHEDVWPLFVLEAVLDGGMSSRIFQRIREEMGAAYYAGFGANFYTHNGLWDFVAGVNSSRVEEVLEAVLEEIARIRTEIVPEEELLKAKEYLSGSLYLSLETSTSMSRFYGFQVLFEEDPIYTPEEMDERTRQVSAEDVLRVAKKYLKVKDMRLAVVGPHKNVDNLKKYFT